MPNPFSRLPHVFFVLVCGFIALALILISLLLVVTQFSETSSKNEMLSLTSFIVILTFSGLAFNWCRVPPSFASEEILKKSIALASIFFCRASLPSRPPFSPGSRPPRKQTPLGCPKPACSSIGCSFPWQFCFSSSRCCDFSPRWCEALPMPSRAFGAQRKNSLPSQSASS